jgi:hypothetical protein
MFRAHVVNTRRSAHLLMQPCCDTLHCDVIITMFLGAT